MDWSGHLLWCTALVTPRKTASNQAMMKDGTAKLRLYFSLLLMMSVTFSPLMKL